MPRIKKPHTPFTELAQVERVVRGFDACTLPCDEWTHAAHLTVGLWYARAYPPDEALDRVRAGIQRYNAACVPVDGPGYHETITRFYMWLIGKYLATLDERTDVVRATNGLVAFAALPQNLPTAYYTSSSLSSESARSGWVAPDVQQLD